MTKLEWEEAYKEFNRANTELIVYERDYNYGANKKIRSQADRQMEYVKHRIRYLFDKYPEIYSLATGGEKASEMSRAFVMDEFFQNRHIVGDLGNLLSTIKEKIESFESQNIKDT